MKSFNEREFDTAVRQIKSELIFIPDYYKWHSARTSTYFSQRTGEKSWIRKQLACPINYDFVMFTQKALKTRFPLEEIDVTTQSIAPVMAN